MEPIFWIPIALIVAIAIAGVYYFASSDLRKKK
ncbi:hypothetical protein HDA39_002439 [Kribbella italica]|uniref:Uncharacterized protein n=1 Tax=Kribbella italica TaxID=1540520 RepID=A0A7W9J5W3_9ACTN|nr:hypothetical protein [Kribbella italica]